MTERREEFDYIIAGAGSAGCVLAARLAEDPQVTVLLLEAGGPDNHWSVRMPGGLRAHYRLDSKFNYHFETVPQKHCGGRTFYQPRGKVLGGSSSINGMVYLRGHPLDYARWVQEGCAGWSYEEVLPYFKKLEAVDWGADAYRGGDGPVKVTTRHDELDPLNAAFIEAGKQAGFPFTSDVNGKQQEGFSIFQWNVDKGVRSSSAYAYLHKGGPKPNLTVRTHCLASEIILNAKRAEGLRYLEKDQARESYARAEVIVCGGAYGSPQILMLSGVGPGDHLRDMGIEVKADLPGVGQNLHDHLEIHVQHKTDKPVSLNRYLALHRKLFVGAQWFLTKSGVTARNQANCGAFLCSNSDAAHPNVQFHFFPAFFSGWDPRPDEHGYRLGSGAMRPESRGEVKLASTDPRDSLLIDPNFLASERDRIEMREAFWLARETLRQPAFAPFDAGEVDPGRQVQSDEQVDAYIRDHAGSAYHPCGACKMGPESDEMAVTDAEGRVRGLNDLRVIDASIMPSIASSNINCVVMMMAEKLADAIKGAPPLPREEVEIVARVGEWAGAASETV